jgi:hypothetical protein
MVILHNLNKLLIKLQDDSIPNEGRLPLGLFILCTISLLCFLNILFYILVLFTIETKFMQEKWSNGKY